MLKTEDGLHLFTREWDARQAKALVVMTHGFGEHSGRYNILGQVLAESGYTLYAYDVRGHGQSEGPRGHIPHYDALLNDLDRVMQHARRKRKHLPLFAFGHSMGGNIALNYALRRKGDINGIITTSPMLRLAFAPPAWKTSLAKLLANVYPRFNLPANIDSNALSHDRNIGMAYRKDDLVHDRMSAKAYVSLMGAGKYALDHAATLTAPTLLMHGGDDALIDCRATEEFYARMTHGDKRFTRYDGHYHELLNETDPVPVMSEIVEWLDQRADTVLNS
jgi:acylglycerol lipase